MAGNNINQTLLNKMLVKKFRNMTNVEIEFGKRITVISGKNGTAKSTILGLIAQVFSFDTNFATGEKLEFKTLNGQSFKSNFKDHFKLSPNFDQPGNMLVGYHVYDAYLDENIDTLELRLTATSGRDHRAVVRNNIKTQFSSNTSRNVTHPVIYLSLKRLYPISERDDSETDIEYLTINADDFIEECNNIIGKQTGKRITSTKGSLINSSVVHGDNYDNRAVSSGEDNVGQIVQALFSFKKLSEDYSDYHGGILLIDELDAGLFPYSQERLIDVLQHYAKKYNIQVIASTHSPIIIEKIFNKSQNNSSKEFKSIFLSQAHGNLSVKSDYSWGQIYADLFKTTTKKVDENLYLPVVNVYAEDGEAFAFLSRLITNRKVRKTVKFVKEVSIGCKNYENLISQRIPEFTNKSIIVLDGDVTKSNDKKKSISSQSNVVLLPTIQPPDRLLFKFLFELDPNDSFWHNEIGFTKEVFESIKAVQTITQRLKLDQTNISDFDRIIQKELENPETNGIRNIFKNFYKDGSIQHALKKAKTNPFEEYLKKNPSQKTNFENSFIESLKHVLKCSHGISKSLLEAYFDS